MQRAFALSGAAAASAPSAHQESDEMLVRRIARGDGRAMHVLFARHNVRVYHFIARLVGDTAIAEDLMSEVFLAVWRKADQFEGRSQVSTWLLAIARYKALSQMRRQTFGHLEEDALHDIQDPAGNPESALEKKDRGALVQKALKQLTPAHREVIDLVYYHEESMENVAMILQIPEATVRTRMFYARKRLAALLAPEVVECLVA